MRTRLPSAFRWTTVCLVLLLAGLSQADLRSAAARVGDTSLGRAIKPGTPDAVTGARPGAKAVVFVDAGVPDWEVLAAGLTSGTLMFPLSKSRDGVEQIAGILAARHLRGLSSIQIVSHGLEGELRLGSTVLTERNLPAYAGALAAIGESLAPGGDLALYGCYVGHGDAGQQFLNALAAATRADVAASSRPIGRTATGTNWTLDRATGPIEAAVPFTVAAMARHRSELAGILNGQLWYAIGGAPQDTSEGHINSDASNPTLIPPHVPGYDSAATIGLDLPAGFYFVTSSDGLNIEARRVSDGVRVDELQIGDAASGPATQDIVNALVVDPINKYIYVGKWGQTPALSGIVRVSYNPATGDMDNTQAIGPTQTLLVNGTQAGNITDPRALDLETDYVAGGGNDFLYFTDNDNLYSGGGFSPRNGVYRLDLNNPSAGVTLLSSQVQFPTTNVDTIGPLAVDTAHGLIYFETHALVGSAAKLWYMPIGGGLATQMTPPCGAVLSITDYPTAGLTLDPQTRQLYVSVQSNHGQGFSQEAVYQAQLSADGHSFTSCVNITDITVLDGHVPDTNAHVHFTTFNLLPVLTITGTTTHAVEQGGFVDLTASNTSTDADGDHYASATVQITGGTFSSNETSANDDHLSVLDGVTNRTSGTVTGTNITVSYDSATEKLTLTGYDTIAHYNTVLGNVRYNATGDNPTNYGSNPTRTISWTVSDGSPSVPFGGQNTTTTTLTIDAVNDPPVNTVPGTQTVNEDTNLAITGVSISDVDANPASHTMTVTLGVTNGTVTVLTNVGGGLTAGGVSGNNTDTVTLTGTRNAITTTLAAVNGLVYRDTLNHFGSITLTITTTDGGNTGSGGALQDQDTIGITVNPVADTPSVTNAATNEDTQSALGLVISRNAGDGAEVTHFKITGITNGTLVKNDGSTAITNGTFITFTEGNAGLKFTPATNAFSPGTAFSITVQASISNADAGLGGSTLQATITVNPVADTPSVTGATTLANVQTTSGLAISRNAADSTEVTHFKITNIVNGTLFKNDGTTPIAHGDFITFTEGNTGLKFTPTSGQAAAGGFDVQAALDDTGSGISGAAAATITVNKHATTTAITSDEPDPSMQNSTVTVAYTVGGAGPTPTGTVTVTISGGSETCSATVAAGQCDLVLTEPGSRTVTASYGGDPVSLVSNGTAAHVVNACTANPTVVNTNNSGAGSLRNAIDNACPGTTITFDAGVTGTISLSTVELTLARNVTIIGPGANVLTVASTGPFRVFDVSAGVTATIRGLTIANGGGGSGAGIRNRGNLTITGSALTGNAATFRGGAISNDGFADSVTLTIADTTISGNSAVDGGAIDNLAAGGHSATLSLTNVTISGNTATRNGGGIDHYQDLGNNATATLTNVTITNNRSDGDGDADGSGGGINAQLGTTVVLRNTIVAGNFRGSSPGTTADDVTGTITTGGSSNNLISNDTGLSGLTHGDNGNQIGTAAIPIDARLGPLANNGGPLLTHALLNDSPALEAGDDTVVTTPPFDVPFHDSRGSAFPRIRDAADANTTQTVDIGAFEADPSVENIADKSTAEDVPAVFTFKVGDGASAFSSITASSSNTTLLPTLNAVVSPDTVSTRTLTLTPALNQVGTSTVTVTATKTIGGTPVSMSDTFVLTVTAVADPPSVTAASTLINTQSTSGLVITPHAADGAEVTHFRITNISGGTLFKTDGSTMITPDSFITLAEGATGLKFMPATDSLVTGTFDAQAAIGESLVGISTATQGTITITRHPTTTTVVSDDPDPSNRLSAYVVAVRVEETTGPTPTGSVSVTDGTNDCMIAALDGNGDGSCEITANTAGLYSLTVTYSGDTFSAPSIDTDDNHEVLNCPATPVVTSTSDAGPGSLRQAVADACATDSITFDLTGAGPHTIVLGAELLLDKNLTITGPADETVILDSGGTTRIFVIGAVATVTIERLHLTNASAGGLNGGAIVSSGNLTLRDGSVTANTAFRGGGIGNLGTLTIEQTTISGNTATDAGGGLYNDGILTLRNSTLSDNQAVGAGGIYAQQLSDTTLVNSTLSGNTADTFGGGLMAVGPSTLSLTHVTITANHADQGNGGTVTFADLTLTNTVIAGNTAGFAPDHTGGGTTTETGINFIGGNPMLGPLQNNGGATFTHAPLVGSPLLDAAGTIALPLATDQRGQPRPVDNPNVTDAAGGNGSDIGAYEAPPPPTTPDLQATSDSRVTTDNLTNDTTPTFDVGGVTIGATVELLADGSVVATGTSTGTTIALTATTLADGPRSMRARQIVAGGPSPASIALVVTIDTTPPTMPTIDLDAASDSGISNSDKLTNATTRVFNVVPTDAGTDLALDRDGSTVFGSGGTGGTVQMTDDSAFVSGTTYAYTARQTDAAGNVSTSTAVNVTIDTTQPTVGLSSAAGDPTGSSPIPVTATFTEGVYGFGLEDLVAGNGTVNALTGTGGDASYTFELTPSGQGAVTVNLAADVVTDAAGNTNTAATELSRDFDTTAPTAAITSVTPDPRSTSVSSIDIVFNQTVTGVTVDDFTLTLDGGGNLLTGSENVTTGDGTTWTLDTLSALTGAAGSYTLTLTATGAGIEDMAGNALVADAGDTWVLEDTPPEVTINQAAGQADRVPYTATVNFTAVFSEPINPATFTDTDIDLSVGTATSTTITITEIAPNDGTTFTVAFGDNTSGDLIATIPAGGVEDVAGNLNELSTSTDNTVTLLECTSPTQTVTSTDDDGPGTLRQALLDVCPGGTITFDLAGPGPHTITVTTGALFVDRDVTILGPTDERVILDGGGTSDLMFVFFDTTVRIERLTFANGYTPGEGAALFNIGTVSIYDSTFTGNVAESDGGAITNEGVMGLANSTISGNTANFGVGGGIFNCTDGLLFLLNTTITNNHAGDEGGGLFNITDVYMENTIVAGNTAVIGGNNLLDDDGGVTSDFGHNLVDVDARLGPLQDNGGPTHTHMPLPGSPAIDAGDTAVVVPVPLPTDQRGFDRYRDGADADTLQFVDIGAVEADPSIEDIGDKTTAESTPSVFTFRVGDPASAFEPFVVSSSNQTLLPDGNVVITEDTPSSFTATMTPAAGQFGATTVTITVTKMIGGFPASMSDSFDVTVTPTANTPGITSATTNEDTMSASGLVISPNVLDGGEVTHFKITALSGGTLFKSDGVTPIALGAFITSAEGSAGLRFLPAPHTFGAGSVGVRASLNASDAGLGGGEGTGIVTILPVADTPSITNALTTVNQQTTSGLVITRNAVDGNEVTHYKITSVTGGTLFQANGTTPIAAGDFITAAQGTAGLRFTPTTGSSATGHVSVRASVSNADGGLGGATVTADIVVIGTFTDNPLVPGVTEIELIHLLELRARVNAQRLRFGLGEAAFSAKAPGVSMITAQDLLQIRVALSEAYVAHGLTAPTFTDPGLPAGTVIKAVHFQELRAAIIALEAS